LQENVVTVREWAASKGRFGVAFVCLDECDNVLGKAANAKAPARVTSFYQGVLNPILKHGQAEDGADPSAGKFLLCLNGNFAGERLARDHGHFTESDAKQLTPEHFEGIEKVIQEDVVVPRPKDGSRSGVIRYVPYLPLPKETISALLLEVMLKLSVKVKANTDVLALTVDAEALLDPDRWGYSPHVGWRQLRDKATPAVEKASQEIINQWLGFEEPKPAQRLLLSWDTTANEVRLRVALFVATCAPRTPFCHPHASAHSYPSSRSRCSSATKAASHCQTFILCVDSRGCCRQVGWLFVAHRLLVSQSKLPHRHL
jgi:hypothetical protein